MKANNESETLAFSPEEIKRKISEMVAAHDIDGLVELQHNVTGLYINMMRGPEEECLKDWEFPPFLPDTIT